MRVVNVGLIGLGTVGSGVVRVIQRHHDDYRRAHGLDLCLKRVCDLDPARARTLGLDEQTYTSDWHDIVNDPAIDIVIELIGGMHPAVDIFEAAFAAKKHVISANKAMLSSEVGRLAALAHEAGVQLKCEAAAAGGIPIVKALENSFAGNDIQTIAGIVNGTTNYILTKMEEENLSFDDVLASAQALGYAEANPSADVDGWDAASKMALLATIGFKTRVNLADVSCVEGIRNISLADIRFARQAGYRIKLLGIAHKVGNCLDVRVHPAMIPINHQLAGVDGVFNAVYVVGDAVGETMFFGAGAGSFPTASAILGDILDLSLPLAAGSIPAPEAVPYRCTYPIMDVKSVRDQYYIRLSLQDRPGILGEVASIFAESGVSLASVTQPLSDAGSVASLIVVTHTASEEDVQKAVLSIEALDGVCEKPTLIRVENTELWKSGILENA